MTSLLFSKIPALTAPSTRWVRSSGMVKVVESVRDGCVARSGEHGLSEGAEEHLPVMDADGDTLLRYDNSPYHLTVGRHHRHTLRPDPRVRKRGERNPWATNRLTPNPHTTSSHPALTRSSTLRPPHHGAPGGAGEGGGHRERRPVGGRQGGPARRQRPGPGAAPRAAHRPTDGAARGGNGPPAREHPRAVRPPRP
jgi:hypothetical protein